MTIFVPIPSKLYRAGITAADVLAAPAAGSLDHVNGAGSLSGTYYVKVVAVTPYGRTTAYSPTGSPCTVAPTDDTVRLSSLGQVATAIAYDIYMSTDADPFFVSRITEDQRVSGCRITATDTVVATATGYIDIEAVGATPRGQAAATASQNTAYNLAALPVIDCFGNQYVDFDLFMSCTGDGVSPALVPVPFFYNTLKGAWVGCEPETVSFGGGGGTYQPMHQRFRLETRGAPSVLLAIAHIAGTGASLDIYTVLS